MLHAVPRISCIHQHSSVTTIQIAVHLRKLCHWLLSFAVLLELLSVHISSICTIYLLSTPCLSLVSTASTPYFNSLYFAYPTHAPNRHNALACGVWGQERQRGENGVRFFLKHRTLNVRLMVQMTPFHSALWFLLTLGGALNERSLMPMLAWLVQQGHAGVAMGVLSPVLNWHTVQATREEVHRLRDAGAGRGGHLSERDRCREGGRHRAAADGVLTPAPKPAAVAAAAVAAAAVAAARGGAAAAYKHPIKLTIDLIETIFNANAESSSTAEETATISATGSQKRGKGGKKGGKGGGGGGGASGGGPRTAGPAGGGTGPGGVAVAPQQQQQPQQ
ncbi:unnamed protein product [Closterium sp. NIES-54]